MLLSMKWLNEYVDVSDIDIKEFCNQMTMSGSKVEGYKAERLEIERVVVGKIMNVSKHPDADKLSVCQVDVGEEKMLQVITAAKNIFEGAVVPVALHKSKLANGAIIKKGKLRGLVSEGMFCSIEELGLTKDDVPEAPEDGILIIENEEYKLGQDIKSIFGIDDIVVDFEITPNRPDCLSVIGLAREVAAVFNKPVKYYEEKVIDKKLIDEDIIKVNIEDKSLCDRYIAKVVKDVKIGPSPKFIRERLKSSGIRPINNIVDITNYVMLEYGRPIHAFDYDKINGKNIILRKARSGETIELLDGSEKKLDEEMLIVADKNRPLAIAGIMGGEGSGISENTKTVVFEVASFDSESVRKTSKKIAIRTESSVRFEKGIDNSFSEIVINKICKLVEDLKIGRILEGIIDINNIREQNREIEIKYDFINRVLELNLSKEEINEILSRLNINVKDDKAIVPSWRKDLIEVADIVEEIARLYGYDKIKSTKLDKIINPVAAKSDKKKFEDDILDFMTAQGYYEVKTFSFVSPKCYDKINLEVKNELRNSITIMNPLGEDTSIMRTTAIPSMIDVILKNYNNQNLNGRFFELAKIYFPDKVKENLTIEKDELVIGLYGKEYDFYSLKSMVENLFDRLDIKERNFVVQNKNEIFHPGRCADIFINDDKIGTIGQINPIVQENYQIPINIFVVNLEVDKMFSNKLFNKVYTAVSKFPLVTRDLSLICDRDIPVLKIENIIREVVSTNLEDITLTDVYTGKQIEESKKSVCYSLKLRNLKKTLTDEEINIIMNNILEKLKILNVFIRPF